MSAKLKMSLLENSHGFLVEALEKAIAAESNPIHWKFAILCAVQSVELLLKERLRKEHRSLLFQSADKRKNTVGIDMALSRLEAYSEVRLTRRDKNAIQSAKRWRNQIVHYEFEVEPKQLKLAFATLLGFSIDFNRSQFDVLLSAEIFDEYLWDEAVSIFDYVTEVQERVSEIIHREGYHEIWECPKCGCDTFVVDPGMDSCFACNHLESPQECLDCGEKLYWDTGVQVQTGDEMYEPCCEGCAEKRKLDEFYHFK